MTHRFALEPATVVFVRAALREALTKTVWFWALEHRCKWWVRAWKLRDRFSALAAATFAVPDV